MDTVCAVTVRNGLIFHYRATLYFKAVEYGKQREIVTSVEKVAHVWKGMYFCILAS